MKSTLTSALCSLMACLTLGASPSFAQPPAPRGSGPDAGAGRVFLDHNPGNDSIGHAVAVPFGPWLSIDGTFGDGIGWQDGYVTASAFAPRHLDPGVSLMFGSLNLMVAENGHGALNIGSGYRYRSLMLNRIFGLSGWFDFDDGHEEPFMRVGVSFESLGKYLDYRVNTYMVLGHDHEKVRDFYSGTPFFQNNFLILNRQRVYENAYGGADFEVGGPIPFLGRYGLNAYAGPYWLRHEDAGDEFGFKVRVQAQVNEDLTIGAQFSNDDLFSNNASVNIAWTIPDGKPTRWFRQTPMKERMAQPVYRERRIPVHRKVDLDNEPLINPADGQPFLFAHIDPNRSSSGNGTIENPFNSTSNFINQARYDVIYVRPGNPANLNTGFVLFDNQRLLSTAVPHTIRSLQGTFQIPGWVGPGLPINRPVITNPGGTQVIQLADNNEVSGFDIDGSNGVNPIIDGIRSQAGGIVGFDINRNRFLNNATGAALYVTGSSYGVFRDNELTGDGNPALTSLSSRGFSVRSDGAGTVLDLLVANNTASGYVGPYEDANRNGIFDGGEDNVSVIGPNIFGGNGNGVLDQGTAFEITAAGGSVINANNPTGSRPTGIINNTETASGTGLLLNGVAAGTLNAVVLNNSFTNNITANTGVRAVANAGTVNLESVDGNTITGNNGNGLALLSRNGGLVTADITNNVITNNALAQVLVDAFDLASANNGTIAINNFTDNNLTRTTAGTSGLLINANDAAITVNNVLRNDFDAATTLATRQFGIGGTVRNGALNILVGDGTVANANSIVNNAVAGIGFNLEGDVVADVRVLRNTITGTVLGTPAVTGFTGDGIRLNLNDTATLLNNSIVELNTITGNAGAGLAVNALINSTVVGMTVNQNTISTNSGGGVLFNRQQNSSINDVFITNNIISGNTGQGVNLVAGGFGTDFFGPFADTYRVANNSITGNTVRGIWLRTEADADLYVEILNNTISGNGSHGIENTEVVGSPVNTRSLIAVALGNTISGNAGNGIHVLGISNWTIGADGVDANGFTLGNRIENNNLAGILVQAPADGQIQNNIIQNNGLTLAAGNGAGIDLEAILLAGGNTTGVTQTWNISNNWLLGNRGDAIELAAVRNVGDASATDDANSNFGTLFQNVTITGNTITGNTGRGIDALAAGDGVQLLNIGDGTADGANLISGNGLEGAYFVLTSDIAQTQIGTALAQLTGVIGARARMELNMQTNTIDGNGALSAFDTTGLVVRVGTTDSSGVDSGSGRQFAGDIGDFNPALPNLNAASGIAANITGNSFQGNQGLDARFGSFVSTPNTLAAVPDNRYDPMARIDMIFSDNTVGHLNALAETAGYTFASTVKSSAAVFTSTSRTRNATLLPANITNVAGTLTVADDVPAANAVSPSSSRFQTTAQANNGAGGVATGLYGNNTDPLGNNASFFNTRFTTGVNTGISSRIINYTTPTINATVRSDFTTVAYPAAPASGDNFQVDYIRVAGMGVNTSYGSPADINGGASNVGGTFRINSNVLGVNTFLGPNVNDFDGSITNLQTFQNTQVFDRPWIWDFNLP